MITPGDNLVVENLPPIPTSIAERANRYGETRSAALFAWHPTRREMLIGTRFGDVPQVHWVKLPGGARQQMTFFPDRVSGAMFPPNSSDFFVFMKDVGGGEWYQFYRFDTATGDITLLTDGKSRNESPVMAHHDSRIAYSSTRRNGKDTDIYVLDAKDPKTDHMVLQVQGAWSPADWSPDGKQVLLQQYISINESNLALLDVASGQKKPLTPPQGDVKVSYSGARFSPDGKGIYVSTDRDSEFHRLAYFDLATMQPKYLTSDIQWDVEEFEPSEDGKTVAFITNENGIGKLHLHNVATGKHHAVEGVPVGVLGGLRFHRNSLDVGFTVNSAKSPSDVYSVSVATGKIDRWTFSETGGLNANNFVEPELIHWKSFDGKEISGFLYKPDAKKFPGKRPVIVNIHGGPEGQSRPSFIGRNNYYLDELGVAIIFPNVRGSTGYGKTFSLLDNGIHRDDTYKDIGALLDWVGTSPTLDASKIMITGGSYGGHMTWAIAANYNDRICCALPVVGISNLVTLLEHTEAYRRDLRRAEYGDERDPQVRAYLEAIAPMNHVDRIKKPIFAVVGKNDPRVPWSESRQILDKLNAQGTPTWFLMANDEGHGYAKKKNQDFQFYATIMFVKRYLLGQGE
jgi:dipeptidyl aminopeptidase/acylaminoacyl peptidase